MFSSQFSIITGVVPASMAASDSGTLTTSGTGLDTGGVDVELDRPNGSTHLTVTVITSYSIHYTKLYETSTWTCRRVCLRTRARATSASFG